MHLLARLIQLLAAPLVAASDALVPALARAANRPPRDGDFAVAAFVISVTVIAIVAGWWASFTQARWSNHRIDTSRRESRLLGDVRLRDVLLRESRLALVVLGREADAPLAFGEGSTLLQRCLAGADAPRFAGLLDTLLGQGTPFETRCRIAKRRSLVVRGIPAGHSAAIFFDERDAREGEGDFRAALEALPSPVWIRDADLELSWANRAFLETVQATTVDDAVRGHAVIERSERDLALSALDGTPVRGVRRYLSVAGERRALAISLSRLADRRLIGLAVDVTEAVKAEAKLKLQADIYAGLLDRIPVAIAKFNEGRRLTHYNSAWQQLWCLDEAWLAGSPTIDEILDRLRDAGRLPEQRDFRAWKDAHTAPFANPGRYSEEVWHTSGERSIRVEAQPDLEGSVFYLYEDISERLRLEARLALLSMVQRATLDTLDEGLAIFDPSGRLAMHNTAFARSWNLDERELESAPHFSELAQRLRARKGDDSLWDRIADTLARAEPLRHAEWEKVTRADGRVIVVSLSHLPNGATAVMFKDVTDIERFTEALHESPPAVA